MFLASAIALIVISVAAVFLGMRQLSASRGQSATHPSASLQAARSTQPVIDPQIAAELEALQAVMYRKPPKPIMTAIAIIVLEVVGVGFVTYLVIVSLVPPPTVSLVMVFYAMFPLFLAFGLWEGRRWAWRYLMVMYGGTIMALPRLADDVLTEVFSGEDLVYVLVGLAWQLAVIIPLWMPSARAWCKPVGAG